MAAIQLRHFVAAHEHAPRLRKRQRVLHGVKPSKRNELWYKVQLLALVAQFKALAEPLLIAAVRQSNGADALAMDNANDAFERVLADLGKDFAQRVKAPAQRLAQAVSGKGLADSDSRLKAAIKASVKVDITGAFHSGGAIADVMKAAVATNVNLITSVPEQYLGRIGEVVQKGFTDGVRWESLVGAIKESGDVADSRAKLIARDQTSKINGAFTSVRQQSLGITKFVWQTAQDERVREEHADLDGEEYLWSEPPKEGMPGEAVNCRCIALPVFELDDEEEAASGGSFFGTVNALGAIGSFFGELAKQA